MCRSYPCLQKSCNVFDLVYLPGRGATPWTRVVSVFPCTIDFFKLSVEIGDKSIRIKQLYNTSISSGLSKAIPSHFSFLNSSTPEEIRSLCSVKYF